jgi:serine/threonine protein kinase
LTKQQCQHLSAEYKQLHASDDGTHAKPLVTWLVSKNIVSRYQGSLLLAGQPGPFIYGNYKIYDRIEQGRLAGSFRAVHCDTNHPVVLLFSTSDLSPQRWSQLAATLPGLEHPNLVRCHEAVDLTNYRFFAIEDLRGATAEEWLIDKGKMPAVEACRLVQRVAQALDYLHQSSRPHGDIRPANFWLEKGGEVKLLVHPFIDLSPVDLSDTSADLAERANYFAPEFAQSKKTPDALTDIYALGSTLFELCLGRPPFAGGTVAEKMKRHATEALKPLPKPLGKIVAYMMAKRADVRFQEAGIVAEQLKPLADRAQKPIQSTPALPTEAAFLASINEGVQSADPARSPVAAVKAVQPATTSSGPIVKVADVPRGRTKKGKKTSSSSAVAERIAQARARRQRKSILMAVGSLSGVLLIGGVFFVSSRSASDPAVVTPEPVPVEIRLETDGPVISDTGVEVDTEPAEDDGDLLWASPTAGDTIDLEYLPGGAQIFLVARLSEVVANEEGQRVLRALGPSFQSVYQHWQAAAGVAPDQIEQVIVGMFGNDGQYPRVSIVVRLKEPADPDALVVAWSRPQATQAGAVTYYRGSSWSYLIPPTEQGLVFVMGHETEIKDLAESDLAPPLLRREIGKLLRESDRQRHATLLFAPRFLSGDGRALFAAQRQKVLRPLYSLLGDGLKAGLFSLHFADELTYVEMRMESDIVIDHYTLAANMRDRLARLPDDIETYIARLNPHPYWRLVAFRYPAMVRYLHRQTRVGVEGESAVINAALPRSAAHNLLFGGEMVLTSTPDESLAASIPAAEGPNTIEKLLNTRISISFDQDSLEFAMQNIENEIESNHKNLPFKFKIKIVGDDLKLDGITRNQQIRDFAQDDESVADVLTAMVMKANPVTTVKSPAEVDQKLLWVVAPDPENPSNRIVLITTRQGATNKYPLPAVFRSN